METAGGGVLVVEEDAAAAEATRRALARAEPGLRVRVTPTLAAARAALAERGVACAVVALAASEAGGAGLVAALRALRPGLAVVAVGEPGADDVAAAALKAGAADYVSRRTGWTDALAVAVGEALGRSLLAGVADAPAPDDGPAPPGPFIATTPVMRAVLALADRAAASRVPVLIEGETGTGKELVARAIHQRGPRTAAPFLVQSCAALPEGLLESELFGHVRGAFTGAAHERRGLFAAAGEGTVFLDEVGEAPLALQAKLLRVLQHGEAKAVGADRARAVAARVVAATNRPLDAEVRAGRFRADLYWRLAVFPIALPPLRHRMAEVVPLAWHFLRAGERREARRTGGFDADALRAFQTYPWPGNVRELENEVHRLVLSVGCGARIGRHHLARRIRDAAPWAAAEPLAQVLRRVEAAVIRDRLAGACSKSAAARSLGITRETLYAKMRRLGL